MAGGTPLGQMYIELGLDVSKFNPTLNGAKNAVRYFQSNVRSLDSALKGNGKNADLLKAKYKTLGQAIESQRKVLDQMKASFDKLEPGTAKFDKAAADIERENAKLAAMKSQLRQVEKALQAVGRENSFAGRMDKLGDSLIKNGGKIKDFGKSVSDFGGTLTRSVTAPMVASAGLVVKAAMDYESAFAGVKKTVNATPKEFDQLSNSIRQMAKEMPASAVEIANVAEAAGQLGVPIGSIKGFTETMINMGVSTNLSSEEAATSIAKIGNIMQVSGDELDSWSAKFGATVVGLGNNFATTERDIVSMANRLAASGAIAGLTTPEILGLATSMSSVGIEAEAGGTAMSQTLTMISKAVSESGEELQAYADTAGMSADQFAEKWRTKPAEALQDFIVGLGKAKSEGKDTNKILDDLGLTGIRQSNMLKSLGLAASTMGKAMNTANEEWRKGTALTDEANKRYATTESKLKMFKNQITDIAIEFGGPLLDALRSGLEAAKPWISKLADMAKAFSNMSKEQQQNILMWAGLVAGAGPALSIFGKGIGLIGSLTQGLGWLAKGVGKASSGISILGKTFKAFKTTGDLTSAFQTATAGATQVGESAAGASGKVGLLTKAGSLLGLAFTPTGAIVLGTLAVGGALAYFATKAIEARQRAQEWGTKVSSEQAGQLQDFKNKVDEANKAMTDFGTDTSNIKKVTDAVRNLATEIQKLADENLAKDIDLAQKLGLSDETIQALTEHANRVKDNVQHMSDEVIKIYQNAANNHRQLSEEEKSIVLANQNELINTQLDLMGYSGKERVAMTKAFNGQVDELNQEQLKKARGVVEKWTKEEQASYKERLEGYKKLMSQIKGEDEKSVAARAEIKSQIEQLEADHTAKMEAYSRKWHEIQNRIVQEALKNTPAQYHQGILNATKKLAEDLGYTYDEMAIRFQNTFSKIQEGHSMWAQTAKDASEATKLANTQWNAMVWDEKTGELKTNAVEEVQKALQAEGGWDNMQFLLKEATLSTNARLTIGEALVANGQWEALSPSEKDLVIKGRPAVEAILNSKDMLEQWNSLPPEAKELLGKNDNFLNSAKTAEATLTHWNQLTPAEKEVVARDLASGNVETAQRAIDSLIGKTVALDAKDETALGKFMAQATIDSLNGKTAELDARDNTAGAVASAQASVNSPKQNSPAPVNASDQTAGQTQSAHNRINAVRQHRPADVNASDRTQPHTHAAQRGIDSVKQRGATQINAQDNTSGVVSGILGWLNSIPAVKWVTVMAKKVGLEKGTNYHEGGLAVVNDQKGPVYRELIQLPNGERFIPEGRDVVLPLPRGSKVFPAYKTKRLMRNMGIPKYAGGVGIPNDAKFIREMEQAQQSIVVQNSTTQTVVDVEKVVSEIAILRSSLEKLLTGILEKPLEVALDGEVLAQNSYQRQARIMAREGI